MNRGLLSCWLVVCALGACSPATESKVSDTQNADDEDGGFDTDASKPTNEETPNGPVSSGNDADAGGGALSGCGDKLITDDEACDDGNQALGDGCNASCQIEPGFACPVIGARCRAARCGDGLMVGDEECEDGNEISGDGCSERCRLEPGYACTDGSGCHKTVCGDQKVESGEQCDDGAKDVPFDGCYACLREPSCAQDGCKPTCGDGIKFKSEACDDGNTRSFDGCSATCELEPGFGCKQASESPPSYVDLPIIYRDLRGYGLGAVADKGVSEGHVDFENKNGSETGIVAMRLSSDKKPVYAKTAGGSNTTSNATMFDKWYRDDPAYNRTIVSAVRLTRNAAGDYVFFDPSFFPLDQAGFVTEGLEPLRNGAADENGTTKHNFNFTSELRTWFEYQGNEFLEFKGDDDVWVFINGVLAVDLGGVHGVQTGSVRLDAAGKDDRFGITAGNIYEIVVFQAERHTSASQYQLTLRDFVKTKTRCESVCGDGILTPDEACDDGENLGSYGKCAAGCVFGPRCGDGEVQSDQGEECDDKNRVNNDTCDNSCKKNAVVL